MSNFNPSYVGTRDDILRLLPANLKTVLDVGCSDGTLGASIKKMTGAKVIGIEYSDEMASVASAKLDRVITGSVEQKSSLSQIDNLQFDAVIFADVLEHLCDPWMTLHSIKDYLAPNGCVIASIPNVRHIDTIYNLLFKGYWPYRDRGIHDRSHLRFFTKKNILELFKESGFYIEDIQVNYRLIERPHYLNKYSKYFAISFLKPFLAFQYLLRARILYT